MKKFAFALVVSMLFSASSFAADLGCSRYYNWNVENLSTHAITVATSDGFFYRLEPFTQALNVPVQRHTNVTAYVQGRFVCTWYDLRSPSHFPYQDHDVLVYDARYVMNPCNIQVRA